MGIFVTHFYFAESGSFARLYLNTWKYNACSIKLETKVMRLHRIRVYKISLFFVNRYAVHDI